MRQVKVAQEQRHAKRMKSLRRALSAIVVITIVIVLVVLLSNKPAKKNAASTTTTTTIAAKRSTSLAIQTVSTPIAPTCPPVGGSTKRYIDFTKAPSTCINTALTYNATVKTDVGTFDIKLATSTSPSAVNNFVFLARYHFYDSTIFQRVIPGFMDQGGDPTGTGSGGPGYSWTGNTPNSSCQTTNNCYPVGSVAMANSGTTSSNGSQFFIMAGTSSPLAPSYTLFGQVVSGMSVVSKINADGNANTNANGVPPKVTHHIISITISQS